MNILEVNNISKKLGSTQILHNISFTVKKGEFIAIRGASGSGKSTLLGIIAGLDTPTTGNVFLNKKDLNALKEKDLAKLRNQKIGFVFQSFYLIPSLTAFENVAYPMQIAKTYNKEEVEKMLKSVGMLHRKDNYPLQLSGGEKQRIAIARSIINKPAILFADEPTGNLDEKNSKAVIKILKDLQKHYNLTLIIVTHEEELANQAQRVLTIKNGKLEQ